MSNIVQQLNDGERIYTSLRMDDGHTIPAFNENDHRRYITLHDTPDGAVVKVLHDKASTTPSEQSVSHCEFKLLAKGGCGEGQLTLHDDVFVTAPSVGQWVKVRLTDSSQPVYTGRIDEVNQDVPQTVNLRLRGMAALLQDNSVGGLGGGDEFSPFLIAWINHHWTDPSLPFADIYVGKGWDASVDLFAKHVLIDPVSSPITYGNIETTNTTDPANIMLHGTSSVQELVRTMAYAASNDGSLNWGIDGQGRFYMQPPVTTTQLTLQRGVNCTQFSEHSTDHQIINHITVMGGDVVDDKSRRSQFIAHQYDSTSISNHGTRRQVIAVPWIRNWQDFISFSNAILNEYAEPTKKYNVSTTPFGGFVLPWGGKIELKDYDGSSLGTHFVSEVSCVYNEAPKFTLNLGPEDLQFPELDPVTAASGSGGGGTGFPRTAGQPKVCDNIATYPSWAASTAYLAGDVVKHDSVLYYRHTDGTSETTSPDDEGGWVVLADCGRSEVNYTQCLEEGSGWAYLTENLSAPANVEDAATKAKAKVLAQIEDADGAPTLYKTDEQITVWNHDTTLTLTTNTLIQYKVHSCYASVVWAGCSADVDPNDLPELETELNPGT